MSEERFDNIHNLYIKYEDDEDLVNMIAELRDEFLNYQEDWSKYDASALQDNIDDYITLENIDLLEES